MKRYSILTFLLLLYLLAFCIPGQVSSESDLLLSHDHNNNASFSFPERNSGYLPQEIIVRYREEVVRNESIFAESQEHFLSTLRSVKNGKDTPAIAGDMALSGLPGLQLIRLPEGMSVEDALFTARTDPKIAYAQPNFKKKVERKFPNDPEFFGQWYLYNKGGTVQNLKGSYRADIHAPEAWDYTTGSRDVIIAVLDPSGVDITEPDLLPNIWKNPREKQKNGLDDDNNGYIDDKFGWDFYDENGDGIVSIGEGDPDTSPEAPFNALSSHGTDCARLIGSVGNNNIDITGVMWQASILPLKFDATTWSEVRAIMYAKSMGARVISCSFGTYLYDPAEEEVIASHPSILFVCSAGNDGIDTDTRLHYPSSLSLENIISVGATDQKDKYLTDWSNYGKLSVDLAAPGGFVLMKGSGSSYYYSDGTSYSTPLVAGTSGLLLSLDKKATVSRIKSCILSTVDPIKGQDALSVTGGRLNAGAAVKMMKSNKQTPMVTATSTPPKKKTTPANTTKKT